MGGHFLSLSDLSRGQLCAVLDSAAQFKRQRQSGFGSQLQGCIAALYMELPSTRTRLSFQVAAIEMGASLVCIDHKNVQIERGEPVADFARICSELFSVLIIRSLSHRRIEEFAANASIPVVNALSENGHPCQILADLMTLRECFGDLRALEIAWLGDTTNVCRSWIEAAAVMGLSLRISTPASHQPDARLSLPDSVQLYPDNPEEAVVGADILMTDVWTSMGKTELSREQKEIFMPYQINDKMLARAGKNPRVLHCMPIHRGEEISAGVVDSPNSLIYTQAGNRLHTHKAVLDFLLRGG